ncbi:hypothetical protein ALP87_102045 [Pseudomonas syringae pv. coriandricola]|nr:hypothetical protein ALP87_102045 [Pseudomonas syringae pv. coriandricola]
MRVFANFSVPGWPLASSNCCQRLNACSQREDVQFAGRATARSRGTAVHAATELSGSGVLHGQKLYFAVSA